MEASIDSDFSKRLYNIVHFAIYSAAYTSCIIQLLYTESFTSLWREK